MPDMPECLRNQLKDMYSGWLPINGLDQEEVHKQNSSSQKVWQQANQNPEEAVLAVLVSRFTGNDGCYSGF